MSPRDHVLLHTTCITCLRDPESNEPVSPPFPYNPLSFVHHAIPHTARNIETQNDYLLARRGRNERRPLPVERKGAGDNLALPPTSFLMPPKAGNRMRSTACPVRRSMARMDSSSVGVTSVIARP